MRKLWKYQVRITVSELNYFRKEREFFFMLNMINVCMRLLCEVFSGRIMAQKWIYTICNCLMIQDVTGINNRHWNAINGVCQHIMWRILMEVWLKVLWIMFLVNIFQYINPQLNFHLVLSALMLRTAKTYFSTEQKQFVIFTRSWVMSASLCWQLSYEKRHQTIILPDFSLIMKEKSRSN